MPSWATALAAQVQLLTEIMHGKDSKNQTSPSANSNTGDPVQHKGKPSKYMGPLATFDRKREELEPWISQVEAKLQIDFCKVQTVMGLPEMNTQELLHQLHLSFGDPHCKEKAKRSLHKLRQGKRTFMEYFTEYCKLLLEAGGSSWPDEIKKSFLKNRLSMDLQRHMISKSTGNESFKEYCCDSLVRRQVTWPRAGYDCLNA